MCNVIVYLAVDNDEKEVMTSGHPIRKTNYWDCGNYESLIYIPCGTIKKLTGKDITWESGYIEYVGDNYDPTID